MIEINVKAIPNPTPIFEQHKTVGSSVFKSLEIFFWANILPESNEANDALTVSQITFEVV